MQHFKIQIPETFYSSELSILISTLNQYGEARLVGGCVRDLLLGNSIIHDIDIATTILPEQTSIILSKIGIKTIPIALNYGTILAIINNQSFEITTLRKDIRCYGRKAVVEFVDDWQEDAARRDFTFNALSMDLEGKVYDYFSGFNDLQKNLVRFIGQPIDRIKEDYLRILRYFRFHGYINSNNTDKPSLEAIVALKSNLALISGERIHKEMSKILTAPFAKSALLLMLQYDIFAEISIPYINPASLNNLNLSKDAFINLAAILIISNSQEEQIKKLARRWRLSNAEYQFLKALCIPKFKITTEGHHALQNQYIYKLGKNLYKKYIMLCNILHPVHNYDELIQQANTFVVPIFPLNGNDLKDLGLQGAKIKEHLEFSKEHWIKSNFQLTKPDLISFIKNNIIQGNTEISK